jgi:hypothetical protein
MTYPGMLHFRGAFMGPATYRVLFCAFVHNSIGGWMVCAYGGCNVNLASCTVDASYVNTTGTYGGVVSFSPIYDSSGATVLNTYLCPRATRSASPAKTFSPTRSRRLTRTSAAPGGTQSRSRTVSPPDAESPTASVSASPAASPAETRDPTPTCSESLSETPR